MTALQPRRVLGVCSSGSSPQCLVHQVLSSQMVKCNPLEVLMTTVQIRMMEVMIVT
uniref:Uncharacterized protein n=1 Tax=Arundo donax TaxID=35708 RepID=A0A0A9DH83_ARUDO